jgi:hypothetical protein
VGYSNAQDAPSIPSPSKVTVEISPFHSLTPERGV